MQTKPKPIRIAITTGDDDGIGMEVAAKALYDLGPQDDVQFLLWRTQKAHPGYLALIQRRFKMIPAADSPGVWQFSWAMNEIIDIRADTRPDDWVIHAALACQSGLCDALVTGPLSKVGMQSKERRHLGHTELLAQVTRAKNLFMSFRGTKFCVILVTGHIPVSRVPKAFTPKLLNEALAHAVELRASLPGGRKEKPVAVVGLNPHAGEDGLIGTEEKWVKKIIAAWASEGVEGPLVPDAAFLPAMQNRYAVFVCPYHDQGLIPFKMVHGFDSGVHVTMGLPFVRTSVDHGTAKEIFGLDQAKHGSMKDAIETAIALVQSRMPQ
jgi:4-hydroxythreonine-4-phosphate dehydrogenase